MRLITDEQHAQIVEALSDERYVSQYSHIVEALATLQALPEVPRIRCSTAASRAKGADMKWMDKLKPTKGDAYIKGNALPESDHETATGRALYTITAIRKAYDAGFADGVAEQGYALSIDGTRIPDEIVKQAVFWYSQRGFK